MCTCFLKKLGLRCMDICNVAQAGALYKVHLMSIPMINCGALKDPLSEKSGAQVLFIDKANMYTRFFKRVGLRCMDISNVMSIELQ